MIAHHRFLLVAPVLAATLSGCGVWDAWVQRVHHEPVETALQDEAEAGPYSSLPPSPPAEVFNEDYAPYGQQEPSAVPPRRFAPPPVPPAQNNESTSSLDRQRSRTDAADGQLIRTLKTPRFFSPDSVRGIYDRIRGSQSEEPPSEAIKREGPIALRHYPPSPTQGSGFDEAELASNSPVRLGIPETDQGPLVQPVALQTETPVESRQPAVVQAGPSSYQNPMYADHTVSRTDDR